MPRHVTSLGSSSFATSSKILQKYEQDRMYQIHKQKLANSKHMLNNSRPGTYPHLILRLKQIQKEEERQAEVDHDNKILLNRMTKILKYGGQVDNWNDYESRSLNYPYRERQTQKIARENRGIAHRLEKVRPVYQRKKWDSEYKQHEYRRRMLADSTKDYTKLTPRRYNSRISKARSLDTGLSQLYEDDFESDHEEDVKTKLPQLKEKHQNTHSKDSIKNETKSVKLPQIQRSQNQMQQDENQRMLPTPDLSMYLPPREQKIKISPTKEEHTGKAGAAEDNSDITLLFKAAKQMAKPDEVFIKVLVKKSHKQRMPLKEKFRQKYDLDLMTELKSGLGLDWECLIDALLQEQGVSDAFAVFDALSAQHGTKTSDYIDILEILCARENDGISELKDSYRQEFSIGLEEDITDRTKPPVQTLLLALVKGHKEGSGETDPKEAWNDAKELHESGDDRWTGESGTFFKLLTEKPFVHLKSVLSEFKVASRGRDVLEIVKEECPADYHRAMTALISYIKSPAKYYAEVLFKHKVSSNDSVFVSTLVTRSEIDMPMVRKLYKKKYDSDLVEDIGTKPHPTRAVLVALASKIPPTTKTKESLSKITYGRGGPPSAIRQQQSTPRKQNPNRVRQPDETSIAASIDSNPLNQPSRRIHAETAKQQHKEQEVKERLHEDGDHNGTVRPVKNFNANDDCERLQKAMDGNAADMGVIISIIPKRSNKQRQELKRKYDEKFKKNLMIELEEELQGDFEEIVLALMMLPHEYDAYCIHEAVEGLGTSEATLLGILGTRSGREMRAIKEHYKKAHKLDMEKDVVADTSSPFAHLVVQLMQGNRETGSDVNTEEAEEDAKKLYKDGKPLDPDDNTLKDLLAKKNHAQVKAIFEEYKKIAGTDIYTSLTKASLGDDEDSYISLAKAIEDPVHFYAEKLHDCFSGLGTNDNMLIRIVMSRSEIDMINIKEKYQELYGKSLSEHIQNECKGDYKHILLAIIENKFVFIAAMLMINNVLGDKDITLYIPLFDSHEGRFNDRKTSELINTATHTHTHPNTYLDIRLSRQYFLRLKDVDINSDGIDERSEPAEVTDCIFSEKKSSEMKTPVEGKEVTVYTPKFDVKGKNGVKFDEIIKDDSKNPRSGDDEKDRVDESRPIEGKIAKAKDEQNEVGTQKVKNKDHIDGTDQNEGKDQGKINREKESEAADMIYENYEKRNETDCICEVENMEEITNEDEKGMSVENEANKNRDKMEPITSCNDFDKHKSKNDKVEPPQGSDSKSNDCREDIISDEDAKQKARFVPAKGPPDEEDIKVLHHALYKDTPINKEIIVRLLSTRTLEERLNLRDKYNEHYNEDVVVSFQDRLYGNFQQLVVALLLEPDVRDAWQLRSALMGFGTDEVTIAHILCTRVYWDLKGIKARYSDLYRKELTEDIKSETSGSTRMLLLDILRMACSDNDQPREIENITEVIMQRLWKPGMKATKQTDDAIIKVVTSCSQNDLKQISEKYKEINGIELMEGIKMSTKGDFQNCLLTFVMSRTNMITYLVDVLSKILKSFIIRDRALINILMTCFDLHVDMTKMLEHFQQKNGKTLQTLIKHKCSGEYGKLLLELLQT